MLIKKKLLYIAVNEISTKAFAVHNWVCGQGVGERPNQEVHPGNSLNLSIYSQITHLVVTKPIWSHHQVETGFFWRWWEEKDDFMRNLTRTLVQVERISLFYVLQCCPMSRYDCHFWPIYWFLQLQLWKIWPFLPHKFCNKSFRLDSLSSRVVVGVWTMRWP